jgi:hypothetical protein
MTAHISEVQSLQTRQAREEESLEEQRADEYLDGQRTRLEKSDEKSPDQKGHVPRGTIRRTFALAIGLVVLAGIRLFVEFIESYS